MPKTFMNLPEAETPLYNHTLPTIEDWLRSLGCHQDQENLHCWYVEKSDWKAEISLDTEELTVRYFDTQPENENLRRSFKYSLSRQDIEAAVFSGP
ncbi:hypothetical protein NIES4102_14510 [Chondrocystis sp. NIES-4102]|nr:hypothetical protein NIES4102_14510 [Chondrocystis sp. NIES-4102]